MARWRDAYGLRGVSLLVIAAAVAIPLVVLAIADLTTAAAVAQLASLPLAALGVVGAYLTTPGVVPAPDARAEQSPEAGPAAEASPRPAGPRQWLRVTAVSVALGAVTVAAAWGIVDLVLRLSGGGESHQSLKVVAGPMPTTFDGGTTWSWLDLPEGTTTVTFSPGGGSKNDGLLGIDGSLHYRSSCLGGRDQVKWTFAADGHYVGDDLSRAQDTSLPDHVDELVLTMITTHDVGQQCSIGLTWAEAGIVRSGAVPR